MALTLSTLRPTVEYDAAPDVSQADVLGLLGKLADHRINDVVDG